MISGFFHYKDAGNDVFIHEAFGGVSYLCGNQAKDFLSIVHGETPSSVSEIQLYLDDVNLLEERPLSIVLTDQNKDDLGPLNEAISAKPPFVLLDLSALSADNAYETVERIGKNYVGQRILIYVPQIYEELDGVAIARFRPVAPKKETKLTDDLDVLAFGAFVKDIVDDKMPKEGDLVSVPKRKFILEPIPGVVEETPNDEDEKVEKKAAQQYEPIFLAIFTVLALSLNFIAQFMRNEDTAASYSLICLLLAGAFLLCQAVPMYFVLHDEKTLKSPYVKFCFSIELILMSLCAATGFTLAYTTDYGVEANIFPILYLAVPPIAFGIAYLFEKKKELFARQKGKKK